MDGAKIRPGEIGARAEAAVASALVRAGLAVFVPAFAAHGRVDVIYLDDDRTVRVQCKSGRLIGDIVQFRTCSNTANRPRAYEGEVDEFGVYSPDTGLVYLVPAVGLPTRACALRLGTTRNGQSSGIRWARDFELGPP
jgi:hypothetical protein